MGRSLKELIKPFIPYRVRVAIRSILEREAVDPRDVKAVQAITSEQWRTLGKRSAKYLESYWSGADDDTQDTAGKRRSAWLADLSQFREVRSVMELGCGAGRNLFVLQQRFPGVALYGLDINPEGMAHARRHVKGEFTLGNLYDLESVLGDRSVDLIFTMGVLIHLHPDTLPGLIRSMRRRARKYLVFVEQVSPDNEVVKGPARWRPTRRMTGDYIQWSPNLPGILEQLGFPYQLSDLPTACQSNGARHLIVVDLRDATDGRTG